MNLKIPKAIIKAAEAFRNDKHYLKENDHVEVIPTQTVWWFGNQPVAIKNRTTGRIFKSSNIKITPGIKARLEYLGL